MTTHEATTRYQLTLTAAKRLRAQHGAQCSMFTHLMGAVGTIRPLTPQERITGCQTHRFEVRGRHIKINVNLSEVERVEEQE